MMLYLLLAFLLGAVVTAVIALLIIKKPLKELKECFEKTEIAATFAEKNEPEDAIDLSCNEEELTKRLDKKLDNLPFEGDK
jgi:hypothetical protein